MYDSVWLEQGKFEAAEAHYQKVLVGTMADKKPRSKGRKKHEKVSL